LFFTKDFNPTAALFPRLVAAFSLFCIALSLVFQFMGKGETAPPEKAREQNPESVSWPATLTLQGGYIILIYVIGFSAATLFYLLLSPWQMHYRRWGVILLHGLLLTLSVAVSFHWLFHVRLPKGLIGIPW